MCDIEKSVDFLRCFFVKSLTTIVSMHEVLIKMYFFLRIVYNKLLSIENIMNLQQAIALISSQTFLVQDLDELIYSSTHSKDLQQEAQRIFIGPKSDGRSFEQINHSSLIGKRAEFILLNLTDPNTGEKLFKNNPKPYHDVIFIPTGEEIEVKSRQSAIAVENYINFELSDIIRYNDATTAIFFIGTKTQLKFYKTTPITKDVKETPTFIVEKKGNSYTIQMETFFKLLRMNANILFYDANITKPAKWFDINKRLSNHTNGGYYVFHDKL